MADIQVNIISDDAGHQVFTAGIVSMRTFIIRIHILRFNLFPVEKEPLLKLPLNSPPGYDPGDTAKFPSGDIPASPWQSAFFSMGSAIKQKKASD